MRTRWARLSAPALSLLVACSSSGEEGCDEDALGTLCTIAGNGENGYDRDADEVAIPALEAKFSLPQDTLALDDGTIYILDWNNHRLRSLEPDGMVRWVAGRGELGGDLDDPANGDFNHPTNMILDETGQRLLIAAWHNSKLRVVDRATGTVTDSCGDGKRAYFGDDGPALTASLDLPASIAFDPKGNLVVMDQANQVLRSIDREGDIHLLAGKCIVDAPAPGGPGPCPEGVEPTRCPSGENGPSGKFTCGDVSFCSNPCTPGYAGDDLPATELRMSQPFGQSASPAGRIAYDPDGRLYFADTANHLIRRIDLDGTVQRVAGLPPEDGATRPGYTGDGGPALEAQLNYPVDLAFDDEGTLYFTDVRNHCVRSIGTDGMITSVVGQCEQKGYSGDGGLALEAELNLPFGVEWHDGRLLVSDMGNSVVRAVRLR